MSCVACFPTCGDRLEGKQTFRSTGRLLQNCRWMNDTGCRAFQIDLSQLVGFVHKIRPMAGRELFVLKIGASTDGRTSELILYRLSFLTCAHCYVIELALQKTRKTLRTTSGVSHLIFFLSTTLTCPTE